MMTGRASGARTRPSRKITRDTWSRLFLASLCVEALRRRHRHGRTASVRRHHMQHFLTYVQLNLYGACSARLSKSEIYLHPRCVEALVPSALTKSAEPVDCFLDGCFDGDRRIHG